jgi:hypothetical protein
MSIKTENGRRGFPCQMFNTPVSITMWLYGRESLVTKDERTRYERLSDLGCAVCRKPAQIHHLIGLRYRGIGQRAHWTNTIALCEEHHTGEYGIHTIGQKTWEKQFGKQERFLAQQDRLITFLK